jgi:undecaprenyl-diphosphatase
LDLTQAVLLAIIQGITEFLPISSSAHLILPGKLLGWTDQGLAFDTSVHLGTLMAVVIYFRRDLRELIKAVYQHLVHREKSHESRFAFNLIIASLPIIPVGFTFRFYIESELRGLDVIIITTVLFGLALWVADHFRKESTTTLTPGNALVIGLAQCLALIPGTSRSGVTITMALMLGYSREQAARISFLIAIPAIGGAATLKLWDLSTQAATIDWLLLGTAAGIAAIAAYACIALLLRFVTKIGYLPFVIYRLLLGAFLFFVIT